MLFQNLIGHSPNFETMLRSARMVAMTDVTVLIIGETGTGKELMAKALQASSPRATKPFVTINCSALPESLAESELFGHKKGSFTGANSNQVGKLQAAHGGTVFLDEIDSLPITIQAKILRFLETGEIQPVGESGSQNVNVRVIAATNAKLQERIDRGEFRKDLYYRLNVVPLEIPPLRERIGDVGLLLQHFIEEFSRTHSLKPAKLGKEALTKLTGYHWPGNVRELRNMCERLCILSAGESIDLTHLPPEVFSRMAQQKPEVELPKEGIRLEQVEIDLIRQALDRTDGNRSRAAKLLGISRDTLLYRMQKYKIN